MIAFYLKYAGGNIFLNTILSCISESSSNFAVSPVQKATSTKISFMLCYGFAFLLALPLLFVSNEGVVAFSVFSSKFFVEGAFMLAFHVNAEIFPPLFVPFSFSACGLVSRIFTVGAPQIAEIKPRQVPIIIFCILSCVAAFSAMMLRKPEVLKKEKRVTEPTKKII